MECDCWQEESGGCTGCSGSPCRVGRGSRPVQRRSNNWKDHGRLEKDRCRLRLRYFFLCWPYDHGRRKWIPAALHQRRIKVASDVHFLLPWLDPFHQITVPTSGATAVHSQVTTADVRCCYEDLFCTVHRCRSGRHLHRICHALRSEKRWTQHGTFLRRVCRTWHWHSSHNKRADKNDPCCAYWSKEPERPRMWSAYERVVRCRCYLRCYRRCYGSCTSFRTLSCNRT